MAYLPRIASRIRYLEALNARKNRLEIVAALSQGQVSRRDLVRWGIFATGGALALKNGLSPFARSAYADVPTGTPPSPVPPGKKFTMPMPRVGVLDPLPMKPNSYLDPVTGRAETEYLFCHPGTTTPIEDVLGARRTSYHSYYNHFANDLEQRTRYTNPVSGRGPVEGRPPIHPSGKDFFAHQRWGELRPKVGYLISLGQIRSGQSFHPDLAVQDANSVWCFGSRYGAPYAASVGPDSSQRPGYYGYQTGNIVTPLVRARYGEPILSRIHNDLPVERRLNNGFGRNEISTHYHNAHNAAESDGANNAYHFPGTFYDYLWSGMLARHDMVATPNLMDPGFKPGDTRASGIDDNGNVVPVAGDFREIQGTMWFHDHRFFFTAENVHKGNFALVNMYSGPDRANEEINDGINLRLPSGIGSQTGQAWGNLEYDVNLAISNPALDPQGQLFFDIFDTDGFLGDILAVNGAYYPYFEVKARRYRFRILNASMARFFRLALVDQNGKTVPYHFIANDGNLLPKPVLISNGIMDVQGVAERYDIVVDFNIARARGVTRLYLVNLLKQTDGRKPDKTLSISEAMKGDEDDPAVGPVLQFIVGEPATDQSADLFAAEWQRSGSKFLTEQIPVVAPVRTRTFEWVRSTGDSRDTADGQCIPECGEIENFPWSVKVNGEDAHSLNATRIGALIPRPGEVEHWQLENGGGGWDHPIHLHFEEGVTLDRDGDPIPATERMARKDVWRLRPSGSVRIQVRFGEFGGSYVNHCHNTTHEDFAMLLRYQVLRGGADDPVGMVTPTPIPTEWGVKWKDSEVLPEAQPDFNNSSSGGDDDSGSGRRRRSRV